MAATQLNLLGSKRMLPLFITQFLGAMNDNLFKVALVTLLTYRAYVDPGTTNILVVIATGLFILPYFPLSATAGQLADKVERKRLVTYIKLWEVGVMVLAAIGFTLDGAAFVAFQYSVLLLLGVQATFFGPVKYGILPDLLRADELMGGNALIEAGTFLAILIGTIAGGILILVPGGLTIVPAALLVIAIGGWAASLFIPRTGRPSSSLRINPNIVAETRSVIDYVLRRRDLRLAVIAISWFWLIGSVFLSQFPLFAKTTLGADNDVQTLFLAMFSVGIGAGAMLCGRLLRGEVSARLTPVGAVGMTLFTVDLYFASFHAVGGSGGTLVGIGQFLSHPANWRVCVDLLAIALCGGIFTVPLYALLQARSEESHRSRVVATNNIVNALFLVIGAIVTAIMGALHLSVPEIFLCVGIANLAAAIVVIRLVPGVLLKAIAATLFRLLYRVEVKGIENFHAAGPRVVIVANHLSFLDGPILAAMLPVKASFAIYAPIARKWWIKPFLRIVEPVPIEPSNPFSAKTMIRAVEAGRPCVIFPEGRITVTGALMKVYEGPGTIADKAGAMLLPVRIDGPQYTPFSRLGGKIRRRWFPKVTITFQAPRRLAMPTELRGRARRRRLGLELYDIMSNLMFETSDTGRTLYDALLDARDRTGAAHIAIEDLDRQPLSYGRLVVGSLLLAKRLEPGTERGEKVGLLLPNAVATVATFFALQRIGRVPAMLNFSTGAHGMTAAATLAGLRTIVTSRRFVERARLAEAIAALGEGRRIVYLEDVRQTIGTLDRIGGFFAAHFARQSYRRNAPDPDSPAVVLFTSGSEGSPKGVVLSHRNIIANCRQVAARVDFTASDIVLNALPIFHSFGLTGGLVLPLISGVRSFLYPSPLHYRIVPEICYDTNATILFGTDVFLTGYGRAANPYDFYSVRYVFAGAERVRDETRRVWTEKFGLRILEGYGATETAPVLATNTPMHFRAGSVGRLLPGITPRLEPVAGIDEGGRLHVTGPNVMLGYIDPQDPSSINPPPDRWYDTGDIVAIDEEGFVRILGRVKRFAKVAGEMVSLGAVEEQAAALWPTFHHTALALPDPRKGEQVVLATDNPDATAEALSDHLRARGVAEVMMPRRVLKVPAIPQLATGKPDYPAVQGLVEGLMAETHATPQTGLLVNRQSADG
jgi:acyl-[acyl-carrier-protein]-phospholipid O-acyltransferase/long-chain-fatty-acid--[acyl-carrier-protein] ligase